MARVPALNGALGSTALGLTYAPVARRRPVDVVQPGTTLPAAPYVAAERDVDGPTDVSLSLGGTTLRAGWDGRVVALHVGAGGRTTQHVSRRHGRGEAPTALAVALTGSFVTAFVREAGAWRARAVVDLAVDDRSPRVQDPRALEAVSADGDRVGCFGQLGLRDVRLVTHADGTPYVEEGRALLTATSAGPGGFRTGHTSVWALDPATYDLAHRADLFFRRDGRVQGDHASHLVRDGDRWLVATSTWGDFDRRLNPRVGATLTATTVDVTRGSHVLDSTPLALPVDGLRSVGTWDPHLVRTPEGWLVAYVSASRFFRFHPVVAQGPSLERLVLRAAGTDRTATEGPTLFRADDAWWVLASDGRDGPRATRASYPVLDLDLHRHTTLSAAYPTNLPWPTLLDLPDRPGAPLLLGFDGTAAGGPLLGYGTHGDLVVQAPAERSGPGAAPRTGAPD